MHSAKQHFPPSGKTKKPDSFCLLVCFGHLKPPVEYELDVGSFTFAVLQQFAVVQSNAGLQTLQGLEQLLWSVHFCFTFVKADHPEVPETAVIGYPHKIKGEGMWKAMYWHDTYVCFP